MFNVFSCPQCHVRLHKEKAQSSLISMKNISLTHYKNTFQNKKVVRKKIDITIRLNLSAFLGTVYLNFNTFL